MRLTVLGQPNPVEDQQKNKTEASKISLSNMDNILVFFSNLSTTTKKFEGFISNTFLNILHIYQVIPTSYISIFIYTNTLIPRITLILYVQKGISTIYEVLSLEHQAQFKLMCRLFVIVCAAPIIAELFPFSECFEKLTI